MCSCYHVNLHNQVRGHRIGSSHSGVETCPWKKIKRFKSGTRIYHIKAEESRTSGKNTRVESEVSARRYQAHTGTYVQDLQLKPTTQHASKESE